MNLKNGSCLKVVSVIVFTYTYVQTCIHEKAKKCERQERGKSMSESRNGTAWGNSSFNEENNFNELSLQNGVKFQQQQQQEEQQIEIFPICKMRWNEVCVCVCVR